MPPSLRAAFAVLALLGVAACGDPDKPTAKNPHAPVCPPPPEPEHQAAVLGTIGKLHLVESQYPITRLGDVLVSFKPDVVLLGVRVDPFREGRLEDASFEMTYVAALARSRGIPVEPIDWYRDAELGVPPPDVEPSDTIEIARREADVLSRPKPYTFEQANGRDLAERIFSASLADARHRAGNGPAARRTAWIQHLAMDAAVRHGRPKKVLAVVDVLDRPTVEGALRVVGYDARDPVAIATSSREVVVPDLPADVLAQYKEQLARVRERAASSRLWEDRARVLALVVEKKGACCVTQSALAPR